jgi:cobalamin biosynthesis protein CobD/CbiB
VIRLSINFTQEENRLNGSLTTMVMLIFGAFLFLMLQYNLRSCLRIFEVGVIITFSLFLTRRLSKTGVEIAPQLNQSL